MARVDFYVVAGSGDPARRQFACRLAEKAYRLKNTVYIEVNDAATAQAMDELLWTFRDGSFVPHDRLSSGASDAVAPVTIGFDPAEDLNADLIINLTNDLPRTMNTSSRIAEIVTSDDDGKVYARQKFATYRKDGHTLETHKI
jgi:DNA polymerase-3 subunit chi